MSGSVVHFAASSVGHRPLCGAQKPCVPYVAPGVQATLYQCQVCLSLSLWGRR